MTYDKSKKQSLIGSLKLSLTFWLLVGTVVWLRVVLLNRHYTPDGDVFKILMTALLWYAALGLLLWLPVWAGGKILRAVRLLGRTEFKLQLASHFWIAFMLTYFYQLHRVWMPYTWAFSLVGLLSSAALIITGIILGWVLVLIAGALNRSVLFKSHLRSFVSLFVLAILIYAGVSIYQGIAGRSAAAVPPELNVALDTGQKVMLIGFDGATWSVIDPLMEAGRMPNFQAFLQDGIRTPLQTFQPTLSAILWTTVATGKSSCGHGVTQIVSTIAPGLTHNVLNYPHTAGCYLFVQLLMKKGYFYVTPLSSSARQTKAVWNITTDYDKRAGVVGWWGSFPPEEIDGVVVSDHASMIKKEMRQAKGQLSDDAELPQNMTGLPVYPPELMTDIGAFGDSTEALTLEELNLFLPADSAYLAYVNSLEGWEREARESVVKIAFLTDKFFRQVTEYLLDNQHFDLLMSYFFETDGIGHWMWPYREAENFPMIPDDQVAKYKDVIDSTYVNIDRILGSIMMHLPDDYTVIVISDHGFGVERYGGFVGVGHNLAPDGILMMRGPQIDATAEFVTKPTLEDITPTILTLLGIPVGDDMSGRVLTEAFQPQFLDQFPVRTIQSHDRGELFRAKATFSQHDDLLKEKLRALGYIE